LASVPLLSWVWRLGCGLWLGSCNPFAVGWLRLVSLLLFAWWGVFMGGNVLVFVATLRKNKPYFVATFGEINLIL
jgi:hypothetical protein